MNNDFTLKVDNKQISLALDGFGEVYHKCKMQALKKAGVVLKDAALQGFKRSGISNLPNPKYTDRLSDAIRMSRPDEAKDSIKVHIMGVRSKGSGTFRLRFFEGGTKDRYQKTYKGFTLKKKRFVGRIAPGKYSFFESSVNSAANNASTAYQQQLSQAIERAWNNMK